MQFERSGGDAEKSSLLLKLLFTTQPLSIQVHPNDEFARSIGLANGKTEAWYVLAAEPNASIALGLKWQLTEKQFRRAIEDGSIAGFVQWRHVQNDDVMLVPGGTIHAIGKGLVIAEIQQRSHATFRLFDYGRGRELHLDNAIGAAVRSPAMCQPVPRKIADGRSLLLVDPHFVLERIDLPPRSSWSFKAQRETWLFVVRGSATIGDLNLTRANVVVADDEHVRLEVGDTGLRALAAYPGSNVEATLLSKCDAAASPSVPLAVASTSDTARLRGPRAGTLQ